MNMKDLANAIKDHKKVVYDIKDGVLYLCSNYIGIVFTDRTALPKALEGIAVPGNGDAHNALNKLKNAPFTDPLNRTGLFWQRPHDSAPMVILAARHAEKTYPVFVDKRFADPFRDAVLLGTGGPKEPVTFLGPNYIGYVMPVVVEPKEQKTIRKTICELL